VFFFFFFQAEDGIRDGHVTGVQTCALPIYPGELAERLIEAPVELIDDNGAPRGRKHILVINPPVANEHLGIRSSSLLTAQHLARSEERRVGKECRSRGAAEDGEKKGRQRER